MALPHDHDVQLQLLLVLNDAPNGAMHCNDVYEQLAPRFTCLTGEDLLVPFANSLSHWANRVQFARLHLVLIGHLEPSYLSGRGYWRISNAGRAYIRDLKRRADELLDELRQPG